jgi:hypothetical protein
MARGAYLYPDCKQDFYGDTWIRVVAHPHHVELAYLDKWTRTLTLTKGTHNLERELNGVMNTLLVPNTKREVLAHVISPTTSKSGTEINGVSTFLDPNTMLAAQSYQANGLKIWNAGSLGQNDQNSNSKCLLEPSLRILFTYHLTP